MTLKLVDQYRFLHRSGSGHRCPACLSLVYRAGMCEPCRRLSLDSAPPCNACEVQGACAVPCEPVRDSMSVKSIVDAMNETAAERIDWPGYNADGSWYAPEDEDDPIYAEDMDAPAPPFWASLLALLPGDWESRYLWGMLAVVTLALLTAIGVCVHSAQKVGLPW